MIKIENVSISGFEPAIRGMRNPKNSWDRSDSHKGMSGDEWSIDPGYIIGSNDKDLMMRLAAGGAVHAKYRRMIVVWLDITAPLFWWPEFDTYKVGVVRNSCSFMHKGTSKPYTIRDFDVMDERIYTALDDLAATASDDEELFQKGYAWDTVIKVLNGLREKYLETKDDKVFQEIRCLMPQGYLQRSTVMLNYEVLAKIYKERRCHRLDEWREFCSWIETLPYSGVICGEEKP